MFSFAPDSQDGAHSKARGNIRAYHPHAPRPPCRLASRSGQLRRRWIWSADVDVSIDVVVKKMKETAALFRSADGTVDRECLKVDKCKVV